MDTLVFERNGFLYLVGAVAPITPSQSEIEELAFAEQLRTSSPNENLLWLQGQYVEGDRSNRNGQTWSSDELAIKSLTPRLMPVTVMHDPRTAVGLIADTRLLTPDADKVPRSRIDTALAVWSHRFPEVAEECAANYQQGTLMQSMECTIGHYECVECGKGFVKLPQNAERANWCPHLKTAADSGQAPRRLLRDVNFTGTGLIFGTRRGATGALDTAHLELAAEEIAEFHERAKASDKRHARRTSVDEITIKRSEYDELKAEAAKAVQLAEKVTSLEESAAKVPDLEKRVEELEIESKKHADDATAEKARADGLEEKARQAEFASERLGKLGSEFVGKLPESVKSKLDKQARELSDEDWTARLDELAELVGVKPDTGSAGAAGGTGKGSGESHSTEETSRTALGGGSGSPAGEPSRAAVTSVLTGLARSVRPPTPETAAKK